MAKALSHPVRVAALDILNRRVASPAQIARELDLPVANVAYHVNTLLRLKCIEEVEVREVRGSLEHLYRATRRRMALLNEWRALPDSARYDFNAQVGGEIFEDFRAALETDAFKEDELPHVSWTRLNLDQTGYERVYALLMETWEKVMDEQAAAAGRLQAGEEGGPEVRTMLSILHYRSEPPASTA